MKGPILDLGFCGLSFVFHFAFCILPLIHTQPVRGPVESHRAQNKSTGRTTAGEVVSTSPSLPSAHRDETKGAPTCPNAERWWPQVDDTKEDQRGQALTYWCAAAVAAFAAFAACAVFFFFFFFFCDLPKPIKRYPPPPPMADS